MSTKGAGLKVKQDQARSARQQFEQDMRWLMGDARGRRVAWWLLTVTHPYQTSFRPSAEMAFLEGERNIGLRFLNEIRGICPDLNLTMEREAGDAEKRSDLAMKAALKNEGDNNEY